MQQLTNTEQMIVKAASVNSGWLNCSGVYIGEVLALQHKGAIESRVIDNQLQIRARELSGEE